MAIEISDLAGRLDEIRGQLSLGCEVVLTDNGNPIGRIVPTPPPPKGPRVLGMHPGAFQPAPDFDDPLPDEFWLGGNP
jgi:antitoxin (DNA-binding transcriptional repressor) of toxin-antitoxin stability system